MKQPTKNIFYKRFDILAFLCLLFVVVGFWFTTSTLPFWWDSAGYVIPRAHTLFERNLWPLDLGKDELGLAHSPFFILLVALFWKIFGANLLSAHLLNLIFSVLIIFYTYKLSLVLIPDPLKARILGLATVVLLLMTPLFYAQMGIVYFELPMVAFGLMTIYYYLQNKTALYLLSGGLMIASKETSFLVILGLAISEVIKQISQTLTIKQLWNLDFSFWKKIPYLALLKKLFVIFLPLGVMFLWFLYHYSQTGWFYADPALYKAPPSSIIPDQLYTAFRVLFFDQWRFLITLVSFYLFFYIRAKKPLQKSFNGTAFLALGCVILTSLLFYGGFAFLTRYILITLPLLYLMFIMLAALILQNLNIKQFILVTLVITVGLSYLFYTDWNEKKVISGWYFPPLEDNLEYLDLIDVNGQIASFLEEKHSDETIYSSWPLNYVLTQPYQGYVTKPLNYHACKDYQEGDKVDYLIFHYFSPEQSACAALANKLKFEKALKFEKNGKSLMLLYNVSTPSSQMDSSKETESAPNPF